ncbi:hypothetical protein ACJ72_04296 [Emergomyces africanus]|uniref:Uncharacterized protein n=1 Tax=Emergomyces africanus TaxID=1955775 RepID=A0A1B7NX79_9EURO|nr:hypothetical protein ACJ72_04296 [Emergomyces africanus]
MAEASKDPSPITAQFEPNSPSPLLPPPPNESQSSHSAPQLGAESQLSDPPPANTTVTMRNVDSPAQQLPEEAAHSLSAPPPQNPPAPAASISTTTHTSTAMQSNADEKRDITMSGGGTGSSDTQQQPQPQPQPPTPSASSNAATMPSTNTFNLNNGNNPSTTPIPQVRPGGAPARVYMNEKIVPYLLEGMKTLAKEQPSNPLRVLGEYLIQRSAEVEE